MRERWWICFKTSPRPHWWDPLVPARMRHVVAFREISGGLMLLIEPAQHRLAHTLILGNPDAWIPAFLDEGHEVLRYDYVALPRQDTDEWLVSRLGLTCASVIAYMLELPGMTLLPQTLRRKLLSRGGHRCTPADLSNSSSRL